MSFIDIAVEQQDLAALQFYLPKAEELSLHYGHKLDQGIARRARGVMCMISGESDLAFRYLEESLLIFKEFGMNWQAGRSLRELGRLALMRGDLDTADRFFLEAISLFEIQNARPDMERTKNLMRR